MLNNKYQFNSRRKSRIQISNWNSSLLTSLFFCIWTIQNNCIPLVVGECSKCSRTADSALCVFNVHFSHTRTHTYEHTHTHTFYRQQQQQLLHIWLLVAVVVVVVAPSPRTHRHTHTLKSNTRLLSLNYYANPGLLVVIIAFEQIPLHQPLIIVCFAAAYGKRVYRSPTRPLSIAYALSLSLSLFQSLWVWGRWVALRFRLRFRFTIWH